LDEAIIALEALDRVQVKTGSGIYVPEHQSSSGSGIDNISPWELTESRALIQGEAAALAASHISDEELKDLEDSLYEMVLENDAGELVAGDAVRKFHRIIAQAKRYAMHQHFALILNKLIATTEAEQVELARKQAQEVRQRFSLDYLVSKG